MLAFLTTGLVALSLNASYASFICTDIVGVVFDDQNRNGYRDESERGLSSARIATIDGSWVVTDRLGRFSLPCALTPGRYGGSFLMKLDMQSLPGGYETTTRNPLWLHATAGRVHVVAFGATN